ncbi:uncharacterized protein LOC114576263, partial [Exaiptasia diaphana]|uniref:Endonuclease/exonuclease/phosphatase domain-containing protein n=1 Tax=Exaiptasia diaphana TaxID=2652724 RepID=A0A913YS87_EXADI
MAGGRISSFSANLCLVLCIYLSLDTVTTTYRLNNTLVVDRDLYFVSQLNEKVHIPSFTSLRVQQPKTNIYNLPRRRLFINLLHNVSFALLLLAGGIELNPGFQTLKDIKNIRGLKIGHLNIRSLRNKVDSPRIENLDTTFDVLAISETWLDSTIVDVEISLPDFTCVRWDRTGDKSGGGVAIYIKESLPYRIRDDLNRTDYEYVWIELLRNKCKPTLICCAYRAPDVNAKDFISSLSNSMSSIDLDKSDVVLLGDLNVNLLKNSKGCKKDKQELLKFSRTYDFKQLIKEPTRITDTSRSLIDLIFVNNEHRITKSGIVPLTISDHSLIFCIIKAGVLKANPRTFEYRSYKNFDANKFKKDLSDVPWHIVNNENDINDA